MPPSHTARFLVLMGASLAFLSTASALAADAVWTHVPGNDDYWTHTTRGWVVYDSRRDRFIHHPGVYRDPIDYALIADSAATYVIRPDAWTAWSKIASDELIPGKDDASAVYDSVDDCVLVFGGRDAAQPPSEYGDLLRLPLGDSVPAYRLVFTTDPAPSARHHAGLAIDTRRHRLLLFGGATASGVLNDFWALSLDDPQSWERITTAGPTGRTVHATVYDPLGDRLWVLCGRDAAGNSLGDVWTFDCSSNLWTPVTLAGPAPAGPLSGVFDLEGRRLITLMPGLPPTALTLLDGATTWSIVDAATPAHVNQWEPITEAPAIAFRTSPPGLMAWVGGQFAGDDDQRVPVPLLRFGPSPSVTLNIAGPPTQSFRYGAGTYEWDIRANRPPVDFVEIWSNLTFIAGAFPDSLGRLRYIYRNPIQPNRSYAYQVRWLDGTALRDTGDFILATPPFPVDIGMTMSVDYEGRGFTAHFSVPDDSARMLATQAFQWRVPPANWITLQSVAYLDPQFTRNVNPAIPDTTYEYRAIWGDPAAPYSSTFAIRTLPVPRFESISTSSNLVDIRWRIRAGYPFSPIVARSGPYPDPIDRTFGPIAADANGLIRLRDSTVVAGASYNYVLQWMVGSVLLNGGQMGAEVPADTTPTPPPPPAQFDTGLTGVVNPAAGQLQFTVQVSSSDRVQITVLDLAGRILWRGEYGPGEHPVVVRGDDWPPGTYFVRLKGMAREQTKRIALID